MRIHGRPTGRVAWLQGKSVEEEVKEDSVTAGGPAQASNQHIVHIVSDRYPTLTLGQCALCPRSRAHQREQHTRCGAGSPRPLRCLLSYNSKRVIRAKAGIHAYREPQTTSVGSNTCSADVRRQWLSFAELSACCKPQRVDSPTKSIHRQHRHSW